MQHIMIDLETMGNRPGAAILSISALQFDLATGQTGKEFEVHISLESSLNHGFRCDASTVLWWMMQDDNARHLMNNGQETLSTGIIDAISQFSNWFQHVIGNGVEKKSAWLVWGNSARFDLGILEAAYQLFKLSPPWSHWNERDVRTMAALLPEVKKATPSVGIAHNGLDDCRYQVNYLCEIYRQLFAIPNEIPQV